ncbi:MAG: tetratricopeptide repeat protein [Kiritimatiellae bacterium]|nr:tetratricopeptide repeat protein [Kiritimatiellia bacterium]
MRGGTDRCGYAPPRTPCAPRHGAPTNITVFAFGCTERRWDIERYGADFVAYRDADRLRFANKPAQALAKYAEVIKTYPGTVYAEAATVYSGYCHRELEDYATAEKLWREQLKNPWGLYRGEICLALANMEFEYRLRPQEAEYWYKKAIEWMDKVGLVDKKMFLLGVPGKAFTVSAPPIRMKEQKAWFGPPDWSKVKPGTIINRRTCHWYLNKLRLDAHGKLALIKFLGGDAKGAQDEIAAILKYDDDEKRMHEKGEPNSYRRLHWEFEHGYLRAPPDEFAAFKGRAKVLVAIGDYYYEIEDWPNAQRAYDRLALLHRQRRISLTKPAEAYLTYIRGMTRYVQKEFEKALPFLRKFDTSFQNTDTWLRAKGVQARIAMQREGCDAAVAILDEIIKHRPRSEYAREALYAIGELYYCWSRYDESERTFRKYVKRYPDKPMAAETYFESIARERAKKGG